MHCYLKTSELANLCKKVERFYFVLYVSYCKNADNGFSQAVAIQLRSLLSMHCCSEALGNVALGFLGACSLRICSTLSNKCHCSVSVGEFRPPSHLEAQLACWSWLGGVCATPTAVKQELPPRRALQELAGCSPSEWCLKNKVLLPMAEGATQS